jgi:hypothetical protein
MKDHVRKALTHSILDHYLSKRIQNELLHLMATSVKDTTLEACKAAKYYSIIADCTRDISRVEQMTLTIRFVTTAAGKVDIQEHFVGYVVANASTGEGLTETILDQLSSIGLKLEDCRGQGYDNGSNMKGIHHGVQKRILDLNARAFFVPCACHSLNLVVKDAAESCLYAVSMFSFLQKLYALCSGSTQRWAILMKHAPSFTLKSVSTTRWQARVDSVKAVRYQLPGIYDALLEMANTLHDTDSKWEAECLGNELKKYRFIVSLVIWYDILFKINVISKVLQSISMELDTCVSEIDKGIKSLFHYRDTGFAEAQCKARELAEDLDVEAVFTEDSTLRARRKKRNFDYEGLDDVESDPEQKFKREFFYVIVDQAISSMKERFEQIKAHGDNFGFLYDISKVSKMTKCDLTKHCQDLELALEGPSDDQKPKSDINALELSDELSDLSTRITTPSSAIESLHYILSHNYEELYTNTVIALQILLTLPVTVASGERDFSRLKLIKTYLRSTMSQERLSDLAQISIEHDVCSKINFDSITKRFAEAKARRVNLDKL